MFEEISRLLQAGKCELYAFVPTGGYSGYRCVRIHIPRKLHIPGPRYWLRLKMDITPEKPRTKRLGRPPAAASKYNGYLQQQIMAAEEAVRQLKEAQAMLEEDNAQQQPRLDIFDIGLKAADAHLSFLLISRCSFSRQTRHALALEDANQVTRRPVLRPCIVPRCSWSTLPNDNHAIRLGITSGITHGPPLCACMAAFSPSFLRSFWVGYPAVLLLHIS